MNDSFENAIKIGDEIVFSPGTDIEERRTVVGKGSIILDRPLDHDDHTSIKVIKGPEKENNNLGIIIGGGVGGVVLIGLIIFLIIYLKKK